MFPIRDSVPSRRPPVAVYLVMALCGIAFAGQITLPPLDSERLVLTFGVQPSAWGLGFPPLWQLVSSQFLHGSLAHLLGNLWMLWIFGDNVEDRMGSVRFVAFYLLCGVLAGVAHLLTNSGSVIPAIGASGSIAGVMGAYLILFPRARVILLFPVLFIPYFFEVPAVVFLIGWFVLQSFSGLIASSVGDVAQAGVAHWAHVGGFAAGLLLVRPFLKPLAERRVLFPDEWGPEAAWRRHR